MAEPISFTTRPVYMGRRGVIAGGHYLAARAGLLMFERGGNAVDAAVASGFALCLLEPDKLGIGGEVPMLIYAAAKKRVYALSGQGWVGRAATLDWFRQAQIDPIPGDGFLSATVPATFGTFALALQRFGTLTLADVVEPAIDYAQYGWPLYPTFHAALGDLAKLFRERYPTSADVYLPGGRVPEVGTLMRNPDWARTLKRVVEVEKKARRRGRRQAIQAAIDFWYKGDIAARIVRFLQTTEVLDDSGRSHRGLLTLEDFADWRPQLEAPVTVRYRGLDVYKCPPWSQGPVFLQQLRLLEGFDLQRMTHNAPPYIHTLIESAKLAFADRERYYGDPDFADVPLGALLSAEYADARRRLIDPDRAALEVKAGEMLAGARVGVGAGAGTRAARRTAVAAGDTTHTCAIDSRGNMVAATPSGGWVQSSPVIPGLGFPMGTRAQMFFLDPDHPNSLAPRKRPRTTLTPSLVLKDGRPCMVFGTPGGDQQDQWTLQFFLNVVEFGMNLQQAVDEPTFHSLHFPSSFYPRDAHPGMVVVEDRIPEGTRRELEARGHNVRVAQDWTHGRVMAARLDHDHGVIHGAVSPRGHVGYVMGS